MVTPLAHPMAVITIGLPDIGRTEQITRMAPNIPIVGPKIVRTSHWAMMGQGLNASATWGHVRRMAAAELQRGSDVAIDSIGSDPGERHDLAVFCRSVGAQSVVALWVDCELKDYGSRSPMIANLWSKIHLQPPTASEGFDQIIYMVVDIAKLERVP